MRRSSLARWSDRRYELSTHSRGSVCIRPRCGCWLLRQAHEDARVETVDAMRRPAQVVSAFRRWRAAGSIAAASGAFAGKLLPSFRNAFLRRAKAIASGYGGRLPRAGPVQQIPGALEETQQLKTSRGFQTLWLMVVVLAAALALASARCGSKHAGARRHTHDAKHLSVWPTTSGGSAGNRCYSRPVPSGST